MPNARIAKLDDLTSLLELFSVSESSPSAEPVSRANEIWCETLSRDGVHIFVSDANSHVVATCMLITAPNLLRSGQQHAFLENVFTHPEYQGRGYGSAVINAALETAWHEGCYHVLLQSGRKDPRVHHFYEKCGFEPGLRVGYVVHRPKDRQPTDRS